MDAAERLQADPGLIVKNWGEDLSVLFAPSSNSTHLVTAPAAALLLAVRDGVMTDVDVDADLIESLVRAGLLRRAA